MKIKSRIKYIMEDMYLEVLLPYLPLIFGTGFAAFAVVVYNLGYFLTGVLERLLGRNFRIVAGIVRFFISFPVSIGFGLLILFSIIVIRLRKKNFLKTLLGYNIFKFYNRDFKIYVGMVLPMIFSGILFLYVLFKTSDLLDLTMLILVTIIGTTLLNYGVQINKIMNNIKNIGSMEKIHISTEGALPFSLEAARMLNNIDSNIKTSIENQLKSERLKTELITNISHDLKTPLTSIINYTDLLKGVDIENDTAKEYIKVLDRNSQRLKLLITDLVDASKTETGNVNLNFERLEINELVSQIYGEFDTVFNEKGITFVFNPEDDIYVWADGNHLGRVLENIIGNVGKYALENTRVYGDVKAEGEFIAFTLKNISRDKLNITPDELMEQFVRGERSRHTEGSGLGLYIAKNLMNLMGGELIIKINGDLYEVKLLIKTVIRDSPQ